MRGRRRGEPGAEFFLDGLILAEASMARAEDRVSAHDREAAPRTVLNLVLKN